MTKLATIVVALLLLSGVAYADLSLGQVSWNAMYGTGQGEGGALSLEVGGGIYGYQQFVDFGAFPGEVLLDVGEYSVYAGLSTEAPNIDTWFGLDRIGIGLWAEEGLAVGIVGMRVIK